MRHPIWTAAALLLTCAWPASALQKGDPAPAFSLTSLEGVVVSSQDLADKVVAVLFWASWGKHCGEQMKQLEGLFREFGDRGLVVLGVNEREDRDQAAAFAEQNDVSYEVLLDDGAVARRFGVNGVPDLWVMDRRGFVWDRFIGYGPTLPKAIRTAVATAVAKTDGAGNGSTLPGDVGVTLPVALRAYAHLQLGAAHINIGDAFVKAGYRDGGHFTEALRELRSGVAMDPRSVDLRVWLALALERKNERAAAVKEYQTALSLDPGNVYAQDALRRLGVPPPMARPDSAQPEGEGSEL